jgi:hypothetical protein
MARFFATLLFVGLALLVRPNIAQLVSGFRPPSVPLIVVDPYLSIWSNNDHLYDDCPRHWSGGTICLSGMISIDDKVYRFMSNGPDLASNVMTQVNLTVYPTQTVYVFEESGVRLTLTFTTPSAAITADTIPILPITYLTFDVEAIDNQTSHKVKIYYDNTAEGTVTAPTEVVTWDDAPLRPGQIAMKIGTVEQNYLAQGSDRINWGYWYINTIFAEGVEGTMNSATEARGAFVNGKGLPPADDKNKPRACNDNTPVLAVSWDLGSIMPGRPTSRMLQISYDQISSMNFFGTAMIPLWKHMYKDFAGLISNFDYYKTKKMCDDLDTKVINELYEIGGAKYATISSLAWRQAVGGTLSVWNSVTSSEWVFLKEISSDGDVSTVDVLFPASPIFIWASPKTLQLALLPLLDYTNNETKKYGLDIQYNLQWAPHHLGHWPVCNLKPSQQEQMPVEESGNMLLMIAGIVQQTKNISFLDPYWPILKTWADFIVDSLPDPGNQLCTDDFEGRSPHNINLAIKGMVALEAYSQLLILKGDMASAEYYNSFNIEFVIYCLVNGSDGDHYKRQYDLSNSWSLKYNLVFQKILDLHLFPQSFFDTELTYYMSKMTKYGIPMDDRHMYTKTDWLMWIAAMANDKQFDAIASAVYQFANETPDRSPFTDWYAVDTGHRQGFTARPVIGGLFARLLTTKAV